jgi:hypothetical protein
MPGDRYDISHLTRRSRSVHGHVLLVRLVLSLGLEIWVVVGRCRSDRASRSRVALDLVAVHKVLALGGDWRGHVTIDHGAVQLLRSSGEHLGGRLGLLRGHGVVGRGRRDGPPAGGFLLLQEVLESDGDARHVR